MRNAALGALSGAATGLCLGLAAGGIWSACFGQPFSGLTGWKAFLPGMLLPGLVLIAPTAALVGSLVGGLCAYCWQDRD